MSAQPAAAAAPLHIAYLVNQYPAVSHTFIRREILALERLGLVVHRLAVRGWDGDIADDEDRRERSRTHYILQRGMVGLLGAVLRQAIASPLRFLRALGLALRLGHRAYRPLPYHLVFFAQACWLNLWLKATPVRHLHAHFGTNPAELALLVQALGGPPYSFTVHGPEEFDKPDFHKIGEKVRRSAFVVAISSFCRSQLFRWVPYARWPDVKVVHCGLERAFHELPVTTPPERPRLVCVGRICEQKGQLLLAQAAGEVIRQGTDLELVFAGDGEMRPQLEALIEQLGIERHVRITGWISSQQVREELLAARALALPSFAEGLPVVIMEAMALGRPVLTTYVAGIPELVVPGECGWLFPAGDVEEMVVRMRECLASTPEQLARMGAAARERAIERHDIDTEAAKLAALFRSSAGAAASR